MMNFGINNESTAVWKYVEHMRSNRHGVITHWSGLVVHEDYFWLGASPNRKVYDPQAAPPYGLVEVKCLGKIENRTKHPKDLCGEKAHFYILKADDKYYLKPSHKYYKQVQGQMTLAGADWRDFLVYSNAGMLIIRIELDHAFAQNRPLVYWRPI